MAGLLLRHGENAVGGAGENGFVLPEYLRRRQGSSEERGFGTNPLKTSALVFRGDIIRTGGGGRPIRRSRYFVRLWLLSIGLCHEADVTGIRTGESP